jgi:hypothetical protein
MSDDEEKKKKKKKKRIKEWRNGQNLYMWDSTMQHQIEDKIIGNLFEELKKKDIRDACLVSKVL